MKNFGSMRSSDRLCDSSVCVMAQGKRAAKNFEECLCLIGIGFMLRIYLG